MIEMNGTNYYLKKKKGSITEQGWWILGASKTPNRTPAKLWYGANSGASLWVNRLSVRVA